MCILNQAHTHNSEMKISKVTSLLLHSGAGRGGQGGGCPPNDEKYGPHNSSKFDEKIGGWVDVKKSE